MRKSLFTAFAVGLCMTANVMAQVPSYVPTNGLVGYWPFNGNANDESGNGNNGTVNGATLTTDRFGNTGKAYSFDGVNDYISTSRSPLTSFSVSLWLFTSQNVAYTPLVDAYNSNWELYLSNYKPTFTRWIMAGAGGTFQEFISTTSASINQWNHLICTYNNGNIRLYLNGVLISTFQNVSITINNNGTFAFGASLSGISQYFNGKLDDIGIWNRALTQQEVNNLYSTCALQTSISPVNSPMNSGGSLNLVLTSTDNSASIQWQSNASGIGWNNLVDNTIYSGVNSSNLTINNAQLWNHNQVFRVISSNTDCSDTSNIANIQITDTCITNVTIYDTLLTTVTDTLIINTTLGLPAPNNENTILIYPNPASDHITIDNGNYTAIAGYTIKIENNAGQQVFQSLINQAQFYVDLSTWSGNGLYFVHLIDEQGNTVTVRKIVLQ